MTKRIPLIPGLFFSESFLSIAQQRLLLPSIRRISRDVAHAAATRHQNPPFPRVSQQHNLVDEVDRTFTRVEVQDLGNDEELVTLKAETFARYGSDLHTLTYFRGNNNLPSFGAYVAHKITQIPEFNASFAKANEAVHESFNWKLTLNHYAQSATSSQYDDNAIDVAFPWHKDIAANGDVTAILTLLSEGKVEFRPEGGDENHDTSSDMTEQCLLPPGSLLLLSGSARWEWLHRVLCSSDRERISVVMGAKQIPSFTIQSP